MAKMTLEQLRALREEKTKELSRRDISDKQAYIVVGMGTCGIAAGAKDTLNAFIKELDTYNLTDVSVTQTGCMGLCYVEPTIEVTCTGMPTVIYGKVDPETAQAIVREHIVHKRLVNDHIFDRPAADIIGGGGR